MRLGRWRRDDEAAAVSLAMSDALDEEALHWLQSLRQRDLSTPETYASAEAEFNETFKEPVRIAITGQVGSEILSV